MLLSLEDFVIPHTFMRVCIDTYVGKNRASLFDPLLSPYYAPIEVYQ